MGHILEQTKNLKELNCDSFFLVPLGFKFILEESKHQ